MTHVFPLLRNARFDEGLRQEMDEVVDAHAIASVTPNEQRGWIADPKESMQADALIASAGSEIIGSYHTHRIPWAHDPLRDTCTVLERAQHEHQPLDVHRVDGAPRFTHPSRFWEGGNDQESPLRIGGPSTQAT